MWADGTFTNQLLANPESSNHSFFSYGVEFLFFRDDSTFLRLTPFGGQEGGTYAKQKSRLLAQPASNERVGIYPEPKRLFHNLT
jgi:hypothetical protein